MNEIDHRATRRDYVYGKLQREDLSENPTEQLTRWLLDAESAGNFDATAMCLSTATADGRPSARYVLLKHYDDAGLCWYSDARSRKGQELAENPWAALTFYWPENDRQVRINGSVEELPESMAEQYFKQRPLGSRLAAAASEQSHPIADRAALEQRYQDVQARYPDGDVPRNPAWRGYRLTPESWEFWQGRESRLHDRFLYLREMETGQWRIQRLMP
ncbi:MAG: pyridoxamine 5'-phosphate oxidase [Halothiobacillaceae bacterium]